MVLLIMAKNYMFTMKVSIPNFRFFMKELQVRTGAKDYEKTIVAMARALFPDIVLKYYKTWTPITVGERRDTRRNKGKNI